MVKRSLSATLSPTKLSPAGWRGASASSRLSPGSSSFSSPSSLGLGNWFEWRGSIMYLPPRTATRMARATDQGVTRMVSVTAAGTCVPSRCVCALLSAQKTYLPNQGVGEGRKEGSKCWGRKGSNFIRCDSSERGDYNKHTCSLVPFRPWCFVLTILCLLLLLLLLPCRPWQMR